MRTFRSLKTPIYLVGITSLFALYVNITEIGKHYSITDKYKMYKSLNPSYFNIGNIPETNQQNTTRMNKTIDSNNGRKPKAVRASKNVSDSLKHPPVNSLKDSVYVQGAPLKVSKEVIPLVKSVYYTAAEFRQKAKQDSNFLGKILNQPYLHPKSRDIFRRYFAGKEYSFKSEFKRTFEDSLRKDFNISADVIVFLHIQKTGGMHLNERVFRWLQTPFKCNCPQKNKSCKCLNPKGNAWIYSSKYNGWPCGLHADWTQLHRCIPGQMDEIEGKNRQRRYFYFTQLRDPISRYVSEFYHQSIRGGHWQDALLGCGSGFSDWIDVRPCFHSETWKGVTLDNFMECPHNLATNRMTRMLADLNKSDCYRNFLNRKAMLTRAVKWVESAKENLQQMEYFGFMEDEQGSDRLFSSVFKMYFRGKRIKAPAQSSAIRMNEHQYLRLLSSAIRMNEHQYLRLLKYVELDIHIYLFATDLFEKRLKNL